MALKKSEKVLVGAALIAGGIGLFVAVGLPQFDAWSASNTKIASMNEEIKTLAAQKESLNAQIALLEKNTDVPSDLKIKTFTEQNREQVIKEMLDQVVGLATGAGNRFISLAPAKVDPLVGAPATVPANGKTATGTTPAASATSATTAAPETGTPATEPLLSTFGYELAVRGTYDTVRNFLKAMAEQKELMEISAISLSNEANAKGASGTDGVYNPSYPIKLTATLRLALQPISP